MCYQFFFSCTSLSSSIQPCSVFICACVYIFTHSLELTYHSSVYSSLVCIHFSCFLSFYLPLSCFLFSSPHSCFYGSVDTLSLTPGKSLGGSWELIYRPSSELFQNYAQHEFWELYFFFQTSDIPFESKTYSSY